MQSILKVPFHARQMLHSRHVSVGIVCVAFLKLSNARAAQPVIEMMGMRLVVLVVARPIAVHSGMGDLKDVASSIVGVSLAISAHRVTIAGKWLVNTRPVSSDGLRFEKLPSVLPAIRSNQTIDRVIRVVVAGGNCLISKIEIFLCCVLDERYVSDGVTRITKVLKGISSSMPGRFQ